MEKININDTWHYKFMEFMGYDRKLYLAARYDELNTCNYLRMLVSNMIAFAFVMALVLSMSFGITQCVIISGIFISETGLSFDTVDMVMQSLPPGLKFCMVALVLCLLVATGVGLIIGLVGLYGFLTNSFERRALVNKISDPIINSSFGQIVSAWHNKICRPISVDNR